MEETDDEIWCFVCASSDPPLHQLCDCKSVHVHRECLIESMARVPAHRTGCPVCGRAYPTRTRVRLGWSTRCVALILIYGTIGTVLWLQYVQIPRGERTCIGTLCLADGAFFLMLMTSTITALECQTQQEPNSCCCVVVRTTHELAV